VVTRPRPGALLAPFGRALLRAHRDAVGRRASSLAYATLVSLVPLLAVVSIFLAQTLREDDGRTLRLIAALLPYSEDAVVSALRSFVAQAESVSSLAVIGFLASSTMTFFSVQETLFDVFRVAAPPSLARRLVTFTLLFFWGPVLIGSAYGGLLWLGQSGAGVGRFLHESALARVVPPLVTFVGLGMLYWRAANGRLRARSALAGSAAAVVLLELLKLGFRVYVSSFTHVQRAVYGGVAIAFFFVLSVQLAWWMVLYGAELAASLGLPEGELDASRGLKPDPWVALAALTRLAAPGRPPWPALELATDLALPVDALRAHLEPLAERGLLEAPLGVGGRTRSSRPTRPPRARASPRRAPPTRSAGCAPSWRARAPKRSPAPRSTTGSGAPARTPTRPLPSLDRRRRPGIDCPVSSGGAVAQLGEHHVRNVGVEGSNPFCSTIFLHILAARPLVAGLRCDPPDSTSLRRPSRNAMSTTSPGAERSARAIRLRRRRSSSEATSKRCARIFVGVARSASSDAEIGKSKRRSTRRPVFGLKKYALAGSSSRKRATATRRLVIVEATSPVSSNPATSSRPRS
jgi:membrane protein